MLATFDENRRAVGMLDPMHDKNECTYRGEEETTSILIIPYEVTSACPDYR